MQAGGEQRYPDITPIVLCIGRAFGLAGSRDIEGPNNPQSRSVLLQLPTSLVIIPEAHQSRSSGRRSRHSAICKAQGPGEDLRLKLVDAIFADKMTGQDWWSPRTQLDAI